MSGGGIIIQRNSALRTAINDSSIYSSLSDSDKDTVEQINRKALDQVTADDRRFMAEKIRDACCEDGSD